MSAEFAEEPLIEAQQDVLDPSTDTVRWYLNGISKVALLNAEQEVELAKAIEVGLLAQEQIDISMAEEGTTLDPVLHRDLGTLALQGVQAQEALVTANLRLVVSLAKRYANHRVPLLDIIQEGNIGLQRAVEKFDYTKGYKFSTYAAWWVRQAITRGIADQVQSIRLPREYYEAAQKLGRDEERLFMADGRMPTNEELAIKAKMPVEEVVDLRFWYHSPILSLDQPVGIDGRPLGDVIDCAPPASPITEVTEVGNERRQEVIAELLTTLKPAEARVLRLLFGLGGGGQLTPKLVGAELKMSLTTVRRAKRQGLQALRDNHLKILRDLLGKDYEPNERSNLEK